MNIPIPKMNCLKHINTVSFAEKAGKKGISSEALTKWFCKNAARIMLMS